jgi:asparagine synthase (glutamine-hydrolysing)
MCSISGYFLTDNYVELRAELKKNGHIFHTDSETEVLTYLIRNGWLKWILREAVKDILPSEVVWCKTKRGFPFTHAEWTAASRDRFFVVLGTLECPYIDWSKLRLAYLELSQRDPLYLWRIMSLAFWWKKCVKGEPLL